MQGGFSQQQLFPQRVEIDEKDLQLIEDLKSDLFKLGFDIELFDRDSIVVKGVPVEAASLEVGELLQDFLNHFQSGAGQLGTDYHNELAKGMARGLKIRDNKRMSNSEMLNLVDSLFACTQPTVTPSGKSVFFTHTLDEIQRKFKN